MKRMSKPKTGRLTRNRELKGLFFVAPFLVGFVAFILFPMVQSVVYSFNDLQFDGSVHLHFVGLENFRRAFLVDTDFRQLLVNSVTDMLVNVPIILVFSMLVAVFLNGKFPGQPVFQVIFFIPVILSAGIMPELFAGDTVRNSIINAASMTGEETSLFNADVVGNLLLRMGLNSSFINYIMYAITNILEVLNSSGIQILVFLIALKAIPRSLYEASEIEGATAWESFWKITFPMVLPQMLVNTVYTVIDAFSNNVNPVMKSITDYNFSKFQFGYAAALSWIYFLIVIVVLVVFAGLLSRGTKHFN